MGNKGEEEWGQGREKEVREGEVREGEGKEGEKEKKRKKKRWSNCVIILHFNALKF